MDERLHEFPSLFELDLSSNNLDTIENVPDAVQLLNAFSNKITELAVASQPLTLKPHAVPKAQETLSTAAGFRSPLLSTIVGA